MKKLLAVLLLSGAVLVAQQTSPTTPAGPSFQAIKDFLGLTDQQVQSLLQLRQDEAQAARQLHEQIRTLEQQLQQKIEAGGPANEIGNLVLQIANLRNQLRNLHDQYQDKALALLTADQQAKLAQLEEAAQLAPAIAQARALGLLKGPAGFGLGRGFGPAGIGPLGPAVGAGPFRNQLRSRK